MQPLYLVVQEEIGLEGLDGITLDGNNGDMQQLDVFLTFFLRSAMVPTFRTAQTRVAAEQELQDPDLEVGAILQKCGILRNQK